MFCQLKRGKNNFPIKTKMSEEISEDMEENNFDEEIEGLELD
jgi:hypothetical protein